MSSKKKKKLDIKPTESKPTVLHSCNKTSFHKAFLPNVVYQERLFKYIQTIHILADHASHALKFYILSSKEFPSITEEDIEAILYLINKGNNWSPRTENMKAIRNKLLPYVTEYCRIVNFVHPYLKYEQQSINYLKVSMITNLKVNVQEHLVHMLMSYINLRLDVKKSLQDLPKKTKSTERKEYQRHLRYLKSVYLLGTIPSSLDNWKQVERTLLEEIQTLNLPSVGNDNPLAYQVVIDPLSFFPAYCKLSNMYETHGFRQFNAIPLRRSFIQSHVRIDTIILYSHILCITRTEAESTLDYKNTLWTKVCNLRTKAFKSRKGMVFDGSITTDGTSVSVYLKHPQANKYGKRGGRKKSKEAKQAEVKQLYVENHLDTCKKAKNIIVHDPNKRDIVYCQDIDKRTVFRYTSNQRAKETGSREYARQRRTLKNESGIVTIESQIPTHKTMNLEAYTRYLVYRRDNRDSLTNFYRRPLHTKWKWKTFINTQKSESRLLNNMKKKYGKDFIVVMGDWSDGGRTARYQIPTKTRGWLKFYKQNGITCFLIDEFRTSSRCPECLSEVESDFKTRAHSRPWKRQEGKMEKVHGLLGCTNSKCLKELNKKNKLTENEKKEWTMRYWNRDTLATCNMLKIVESLLADKGRPKEFQREKEEEEEKERKVINTSEPVVAGS